MESRKGGEKVNEQDLRIVNLRAIVEGQQQTINEQAEEIRRMEELVGKYREMQRDLIAKIQELIDRYKGPGNHSSGR
jgi:hypothetical protein